MTGYTSKTKNKEKPKNSENLGKEWSVFATQKCDGKISQCRQKI